MNRSVNSLAEVEAFDQNEVLEGYHDGFKGEPEPGDNRSLAFWHGWRNGAVDKGLREPDKEQRRIAFEFVGRGRLLIELGKKWPQTLQ